ncbi:DUF4398 domain-containing protein [Myxococcota bacterium]|jgi:hypothetical protein|nr:DUF4398 domain-containing protein [Myxococcota bacterium]MBU1409939.1 DUF4398 domain-containing protein [Myxococcota bacterium]MBU1511245.1 DUF4398 domain-containing protein [Myxococcota bacterium]
MLKIHCFSIWFVVLGLMSACGPVEYMGQVGIKTTKEFAAAGEVKAEKHAPYEYWSARCYLERAREKAGYGDYQDAVNYGRKSEKMSRDAQRNIKAGQLAENPNEPAAGETDEKGNKDETNETEKGKKPVLVLDHETPSEDR